VRPVQAGPATGPITHSCCPPPTCMGDRSERQGERVDDGARRHVAGDDRLHAGAREHLHPALARRAGLSRALDVPADPFDDADVAPSAVVAHRTPEGAPGPVRAASAPAVADPARRRVAGLDGIRGLAAVFVVVNHIFLRTFPGYPVDRAPFWAAWFIYGRFAVVVFIVLSGLSLALSPARHGWRLDRVSRFAYRRAKRILPPYWAALLFSIAVAWLIVPPPGQPAPDAKSVLVNGLLVQNVVGAPSPNRAFWSIAVEAQLYVVFPLLLLMVRRFGAIAMVGTVTLVVAAVGVVGPHVSGMDALVIQSPPDLAALFAVGILCAGIVSASAARRSWPWAWIALAAAAPVLLTIRWQGSVWTLDHLFWVDLTLGPAVGCLIAGLATGHPAPLLRLLDTRPMRSLGSSSYSLYLTHGPIVVVVYDEVVAGRVHQGVPAFLVSFALAVPLTIVFARLFAAVFEIPFRQHRS
jgi:peptidoglycan/LPS O-acetylase OafA/YrhL